MEATVLKDKVQQSEFLTRIDVDKYCKCLSLSSDLLRDIQRKKVVILHVISRTPNILIELPIYHFILNEQTELKMWNIVELDMWQKFKKIFIESAKKQ
jgi:hypothetical protein